MASQRPRTAPHPEDDAAAAGLPRALARWSEALDAGTVIVDPARLAARARNVSGLDRPIAAVLRPRSVSQVRTIMRIASAEEVGVYPISGGRNWGLGSGLPVRAGAVMLDLSAMAGIRRVDVDHGYAVVEPGVSQGALADRLAELRAPWIVDVTGAPRATSIVGNLMDRGVGYLARRTDTLLGLEVVLATGEVVRTGHLATGDNRVPGLLGEALGPDLTGLFVQSNLGVVTAATIALRPRPVQALAFVCRLRERSTLDALITALRALRESETFTSVVHVANRPRAEGILLPALGVALPAGGATPQMIAAGSYAPGRDGPAWSAVGALGPDGPLARARLRAMRRALRSIASIDVISDRHLRRMRAAARFLPAARPAARLADALAPVLGLVGGVPTDAALPSMLFALGGPVEAVADPDATPCGWLFCLQTLPFTGEAASTVERLVCDITRRHGFIAHITLNGLTTKVLEAVVNISFDRRDPGRVAAAHACDRALHDAFEAAGFVAYRLGIQHMARVGRREDPGWQAICAIKRALDSAGVIAPGRYGP